VTITTTPCRMAQGPRSDTIGSTDSYFLCITLKFSWRAKAGISRRCWCVCVCVWAGAAEEDAEEAARLAAIEELYAKTMGKHAR
jgi:hypothetical protein